MSQPITDSRPYCELLEEFLRQLKNNLDEETSKGLAGLIGPDGWERYILELNTFYYQSFHEQFFPQYCEKLDDNIRTMTETTANAGVLKQNLAANLRQWAELYNQILYLHRSAEANLAALRQKPPLLAGPDAPVVELIYVLKDLSRQLTVFLDRMRNRQSILDDSQFIEGLQRYPDHRSISHLFSQWTPDTPKAAREFNQLLASWQMVLKQLDKMPARDAINRESIKNLLKELQKADLVWTDRKAPGTLRTWYRQNIQNIYQFHLSSLELFGERNDRKRIIQSAVLLGDWLRSLLYGLEQAIGYVDRGWGDLIKHDLNSLLNLNRELLSEQIVEAARTIQLLSDLTSSLSPAAADFSLHSQRAQTLITDTLDYWQKQNHSPDSNGSNAGYQNEWIINQLKLATSQIAILEDREAAWESLDLQYHDFLDMLTAQIKWLSQQRINLMQNLDQSKLQGKHPEYTIEIRRVPITNGMLFPSELAFLLNDMAITAAESDLGVGYVISAAGDIFLINVDGYREQVIPKIIVAGPGS